MSQLIKDLQNTNYLENIDHIQFSIFSPQEIKNGSVCEIMTPDTYDGNVPKPNGLFDHRMGSIDSTIICPTDEKRAELCPGYFGRIDLALPVFNQHFIPYIDKTLKCICFRCSNILVDKTDPNVIKELENKKGYNRFLAIVAMSSKIKKCIHNNGCFVLQPTKYMKITKDIENIIKIKAEFSQNTFKDSKIQSDQYLTPIIILQIFRKLKDEDIDFLGFNSRYSKPEWMIISSLAVPPPPVRPSIRQSDNQRSEDDLTYALSNIIKENKILKQLIENNAGNAKVADHQGYLQYLISTYMDNEIPGVSQNAQRSTFRPLKAITQRLKAKEGRMRGNIQGKRVDYSARTVISVDPNINIDQFGMPKEIAMNLTFPEIVTDFNISKMRKIVINGPSNYPGAKTVTKNNGNSTGIFNISLKHVDVQKTAQELQIGDIVHRHLIDGDICLFNRQPTLHRMSMMGHKVKVLPGSTFRLNVTVCKPYNADFDGDEMNCHIPQSIQTFEELKRLTLVPTQIISPGNSVPCMPIVQDSLIAAYKLTQDNVKLTKNDMQNIMMFSETFNGILPKPLFIENGVELWSGKQLFSLIIPDVTTSNKNCKIVKGELTEGFLTDDMLGTKEHGLIKQIFNTYGLDKCADFMNAAQKLLTRWFLNSCLSVSFGDAILSKPNREEVNNIFKNKYGAIDELIKKTQQGIYMPELDKKYLAGKFEADIQRLLGEIGETCKKYVVENMPKDNGFYICHTSGSKGNTNNIQEILGLVGQQTINGKRVQYGFTDRTLPHFPRFDNGIEARGFIRNSFIEGLTPSEVLFQAISGREGKISSSIITADSGYTSRKFIKATEDLKVNYDFTVRNASNMVIQFQYADDILDPCKIELTKIELIELDNQRIKDMYQYTDVDKKKNWLSFMTADAYSKMTKENKNNSYLKLIEDEYNMIIKYRDILRNNYFFAAETIGDLKMYTPVNLYRIIPNAKSLFNIKEFQKSDLTPHYVISKFDECMDKIISYQPEKSNNFNLLRILFKSFLSSKRVIYEYRLNTQTYDYIIEIIKNKFISSFITPGEMVGVMAAQTLGEKSTQMTLNAFHSSGRAKGKINKSSGLPRLKEIINASKNLKMKSMTIYLNDEYSHNKEVAQKIANQLNYTILKDLVIQSEIIYESNTSLTSETEDYEFIKSYKEFNNLFDMDNKNDECMSPWILRLILDKESMINRNINVYEIQEIIKDNSFDQDEIECIASDDNANDIIIRIRIKNEEGEKYMEFMKDIEKQLLNMKLRGITDINLVEAVEQNIIKYNIDGSFTPAKEFILNTDGSNIIEILNNDYIDCYRTITNDINEIYNYFGIEAARSLIFKELLDVFNNSGYTNPRHIQLLTDVMTYRGKIMQIDRHGLNNNNEIGPIGKASFEEVMNVFTKAAIFSEKDNMKGVSSNIFAGQFCKSGTNNFDIIIDEEKITDYLINKDFNVSINKEVSVDSFNENFNKVYNEFEKEEEINIDDFRFGFNLEKESIELAPNKNINITVVNKNAGDVYSDTTNSLGNINIEMPNYSDISPNTSNANSELNENQVNEVEVNGTEVNETEVNENQVNGTEVNENIKVINLNINENNEIKNNKTKKIRVRKTKLAK